MRPLGSPISSLPLGEQYSETASGPELCPTVASINPTQHQKTQRNIKTRLHPAIGTGTSHATNHQGVTPDAATSEYNPPTIKKCRIIEGYRPSSGSGESKSCGDAARARS